MQNYLRQIILPPTFLCFNKKFSNLWHLFIQSWNICWTKKGLFAFLHEKFLEIKPIRTDTRWELSWKIIFLLDKEMWVRGIRLSLVQFIISMWTKAGQSTEELVMSSLWLFQIPTLCQVSTFFLSLVIENFSKNVLQYC